MCFMLVATITSLVMTIIGKLKALGSGTWADWYVLIWSLGLVVLAVILAVQGIKTMAGQGKAKEEA